VIKRVKDADGVRVTFMLDTAAAVSVVGDFNHWDPAAHPLKPRTNGKRSVSVVMSPGPVTFRYLAEGGHFFDDPDADRYEDNGYGGTHGVLVVPKATSKTKSTKAKVIDTPTPNGATSSAAAAKVKKAPRVAKASPTSKPVAKKAGTANTKGKPKR